ncbi:3944_t:CDS:2, partial [Gigaspora margarita]
PNFIAKVQNYQDDKIKITVHELAHGKNENNKCLNRESEASKEDFICELKCSIQWYILLIPDNQNFNNSSRLLITTTYLKAIGQGAYFGNLEQGFENKVSVADTKESGIGDDESSWIKFQLTFTHSVYKSM